MMMEESGSSVWAWEQDKAFESALALHHDDDDEEDSEGDRWERIAALVAGKSAEEVKRHYHILIQDVEAIESGQVLLPNYNYASSSSSSLPDGGDAVGEGGGKKSTGNSVVSRSEQERRKGIAWTAEEHRLFLLGLDKYGKGDWRSISRNFVITRTLTQVASHAQNILYTSNRSTKIGGGQVFMILPVLGTVTFHHPKLQSLAKPMELLPRPPAKHLKCSLHLVCMEELI